MSPCYRPEPLFNYPGGTKNTLDYNSIIQVAGVIVNEKCDQMGPETCKKEEIFALYREIIIQERKKMIIGLMSADTLNGREIAEEADNGDILGRSFTE